ncbi:MAG: Asp-tRNA(Asn)/Glu-tRNA(Gln) amidotransferase subunit GatA [Oscillospiraceae bacterium]|jgi:aspartyl-tRNA(Asn)/glutamyl-tRNA(Gln) amidotransferase subunit A|nr:Asp-tRNA(Asn)/Glu-tRNA(Gln) amidotransferase subunit GatA [Oscillospiraceae bacterium]
MIDKIQAALTEKRISAKELAQSYLTAIDERKELNCYITLTPEAALEAADAVDRKLASGEALAALEGVPFALKDNISTTGLLTTCASNMLEGYTPAYDAFVWERLKAQNAVLLGKANMDEFAMGSTCETSRIGAARNPHNTDCVSGGSSGGSASAVAANLAAYSLGSDTGGSVRQPASFCGLTGLKPTYGAVSRYGLIAYASSLDQIGVIAQNSADCEKVFGVIAGYDKRDMTSKQAKFTALTERPLKIGVASEFLDGASPEVTKAIESALEVYRKMGCEIVPVEFPLLKYALPVYYILACAEASSNLGRYDGLRYGPGAEHYDDLDDGISKIRSERFGTEVQRRILLGTYVLSSGYFDAYYKKAQNLKAAITAQLAGEILGKCDMLLTPTVPTTALKIGAGLSPVETYLTDICTVTVNITGLPALSVPCGLSGGLPIGMQLIGSPWSDLQLLNAAKSFERATDCAYLTKLAGGVTL